MNALDPINLSIEFVKQTVDPGGGGEVVNAQTGDIAIWAILAILFVGVIAYCMFRFSRVFNGEYATATASAKHAKNAHGGGLATTKAGLIFAIIGLIICLSMTATSAIAASNKTNTNNVDIQPDKIQVTVDEDAGTINDATFNFVNNSQNYYLFDSTTRMELTSEVEGLTVPEDWDLQLTTLNTDLYKGPPNGEEYPVPDDVVTLYPGQSAQATLKFNKGSADLAKTLIGKQVFSLTMIPDQYVVGVPTPQTGLTYDGTVQTAIASTDAYTVTGGSGKNAIPYQAQVTLNPNYKWPDKITDSKLIDWRISRRVAELDWLPETYEYNGSLQHPMAYIKNLVIGDNISVDKYSPPELDDWMSAGAHEVIACSLNGLGSSNYTLVGCKETHKSYTISKKSMTIKADDKEKAIDDEEDPELTATVEGNIEGETFVKGEDYELSCEDHPDPKVKDEYAIYVKVKGTSDLAKNYQITTTDGKLVIVDNKPTITPDSFTITYGDSEPALTATTNYTETGHDLVKDTDYKLTRVQGENYGEYKISVELIDSGPGVIHYGKNNIRLKEGLFTINKYSVPIIWLHHFEFTYTGTPQYGNASLSKAKDSDDVEISGYESFNEEYDCTSAGDQKCKVAELTGEQSINYTLDHASNVYEYTIDKADIAMTVSVSGGNVTKPKGYEDTTLTSSYTLGAIAPDQSTLHFTYQWSKAETGEVSPYIPIEGATSANYTIGKDDHLGTYSFSVKYNVTSDDTNFNATEIHSTGVDVSLVYMKMTFNDMQTNAPTELYTHYGTDELYESETGTTKQNIPTVSKEGCIFNGWYTDPTDGTQVIDSENRILKSKVEGYISSEGKWANTEAKTIYASLTQLNYLTFTNEDESSNVITFKQEVSQTCNMDPIHIRYSTNATDWDILESSGPTTTILATLANKDDKLYVAGDNPGGFSGAGRTDSFSSTGKFSVTGSIGALINYEDSVTAVPNDLCFQSLFENCTTITASPNVDLSFTENTSGCYKNMFKGCTSLKKIQVGFTSWPENGFDGWVEGLNTDGTCEFDCPAELDWKYSGNNFCPKEWHNSKGEAHWTVLNDGKELHFYLKGEETHDSSKIVLLDNEEDESPYVDVANVTFTNDFLNWTDNLRSCRFWFNEMRSLKALDLTNFDTHNVINMSNMFANCRNLRYLNLGEKFDTSKVTNMIKMFNNCRWLLSLNLGEKFDTAKVVSMANMFYCCMSLTTIAFDNKFKTSNVVSMESMFYGCRDLSKISCSPRTDWSSDKLEESQNMFFSCLSLPGYNESNYNNIQNAHDVALDDEGYTGPARGYFEYRGKSIDGKATINDKGKLQFYVDGLDDITPTSDSWQVPLNSIVSEDVPWFQKEYTDVLATENFKSWMGQYVTSTANWFRYSSINELDTTGWQFFNVTNMSCMFQNSNITNIVGLGNWQVAKVEDMSFMFDNSKLINFDAPTWNPNCLETTLSMFSNVESLQKVKITNWSGDSLMNLNGMFYNCSGLKEIDITALEPNAGAKLNEIFSGCLSLTRIICAYNWSAKDISSDRMFYNCVKLPNFSWSYIDKTKAYPNYGGYFISE